MMVDGTLEESAAYGAVYSRVDEVVLAHTRSLKSSSPRLKHDDLPGVWPEAAGRGASESLRYKKIVCFYLFFETCILLEIYK